MLHDFLSQLTSEDDHRRWYADQVDRLIMRLSLLAPDERALMQTYLKHNVSIKQIARLTGKNTKTVSRQIRHLTRQLYDGDYLLIYRQRESLSPGELDIAYDRYILGMGPKAIADKRGVDPDRTRSVVYRLGRLVERWKQNPDNQPARNDRNIKRLESR